MELSALISYAAERHISDIHLVHGLPPKLRLDGALIDFAGADILTDKACEDYAREIAGETYAKIESIGELDLARSYGGTRVRANLFRQQGHISVSLRILNNTIPKLEELGLPPAVHAFAKFRNGIVLVTGETGSGKSTTLAAILRCINETYCKHIITLEDPIEYIHMPDQCVINQREIGIDTINYVTSLRAALREDPDVILVGEMRDLETIETALTAAETGHLVFATLHTKSAADSIDRIVDVFPEGRQRQIRMQLSMTLQAILSQQLLPKKSGGRIAACEVMMINAAIRNLIREGKTPQIINSLATSADIGSVTMDNALLKLHKDRMISRETAILAACDAEYVKRGARI